MKSKSVGKFIIFFCLLLAVNLFSGSLFPSKLNFCNFWFLVDVNYLERRLLNRIWFIGDFIMGEFLMEPLKDEMSLP